MWEKERPFFSTKEKCVLGRRCLCKDSCVCVCDVCMCVCMYVCMSICVYACMYCVYVSMGYDRAISEKCVLRRGCLCICGCVVMCVCMYV